MPGTGARKRSPAWASRRNKIPYPKLEGSMKTIIRFAMALAAAFVGAAQAQNISIATGGTGGVYYPLGGGMAAVFSKFIPGMQATAEVTGGSVANLQLIGTGKPYIALTMV